VSAPKVLKYDPHHWWTHLLDIRGGLLRAISARVFSAVLWSVAVLLFHQYAYPVSLPATEHSLVGVAIGLLLVFRTNSSYDRFWEGRKLWGGIVNETRNLVRAAGAVVADMELRQRLAAWTAVYPWAVKRVLRGGEGDLGPAVAALPSAEVKAVLGSGNAALAVARRMSAVLQEAKVKGQVGEVLQGALDSNVQQLVDNLGGCERIHKTPLPFAYMVHLRRAVLLYCYTLPFVLVKDFGWAAPGAMFFTAFVFFGIEEIGVEIEDPFGTDDNDLPLDDICAALTTTLDEVEPFLPRED